MKQTFKLHESSNTFNDEVVEITVDTDEQEIIIGEITLSGVHRDLKELQYLHRSLGDLIEEIKENG